MKHLFTTLALITALMLSFGVNAQKTDYNEIILPEKTDSIILKAMGLSLFEEKLVQLAWQLGNRHLPTQILDDHLRIRQDHVIKDMLIGLGAEVKEITAPFNPESGAYSGHSHSHSHGHSHD